MNLRPQPSPEPTSTRTGGSCWWLACDCLYLAIMLTLLVDAISYLVVLFMSGDMFACVRAGCYSFSDFTHFYQAGQITLSADRQNAYDPTVQLAYFNRLFSNYQWNRPHFIQYVPFIFPVCAPLALLPMPQSFLLCVSASLLFGIGALSRVARTLQKTDWLSLAMIFIAMLGSWPAIYSLRIGQPSLILAALVGLYALFLYQKRDQAAGLMLALTSFKPQYAIFFVIPALSARRGLLLLSAGVFESLLLALAGLTIGWGNVFAYPWILLHAESTKAYLGVHPELMTCLRGLLSHWAPESFVFPASALLMIIALGGCLRLWSVTSLDNLRQFRWSFAVTVLLSLVFGLHTHLYDLLVVIVPIILTVHSFSSKSMFSGSPAHRLWLLLLLALPLASWFFNLCPIFAADVPVSSSIAMTLYTMALCSVAIWVRLLPGSEG